MNTETVPKLAYTRSETAAALSLSLRTVDKLISIKELRVVRVGKSVLVPADSLRSFLRRDHATEIEQEEALAA